MAVGGEEFPYLYQLLWAELATTCGLPATVIPIGVADGLPSGVQIIGPEFEDRTALAFARGIEQEFGGSPPRLATREAHERGASELLRSPGRI